MTVRAWVAIGALVAGTVCAVAAADGGGPSPGVLLGSPGLTSPGGEVRYMALSDGQRTVVEVVGTGTGRLVRFRWLQGSYGIPVVTFSGDAEGLTRDGRTLVLAPAIGPQSPATTRFVLLATRSLAVRRLVTLRGSFSYDALSPDGRTMYLIQYLSSANPARYLVRAYDLGAGRLLKPVIVDKSEQGVAMSGSAITRVTSADGAWVYTLYTKPGMPFVHALDAAHRSAVCIDLPWRGSQQKLWQMRLSIRGAKLVVGKPGGPAAFVVDTKMFKARRA